MGKRVNASEAEHRSVRLNPKTNTAERDTLKIIKTLENEGHSFKDIMIDAILARNGKTPEHYTRQSNVLLSGIEDLLSHFMHEILGQLRRGEVQVEQLETDEGITPFMQNFTKSYMERQKRKG